LLDYSFLSCKSQFGRRLIILGKKIFYFFAKSNIIRTFAAEKIRYGDGGRESPPFFKHLWIQKK